MKYKDRLSSVCAIYIQEGEELLKTKWIEQVPPNVIQFHMNTYVDLQLFTKWHSNCCALMHVMGKSGKPWEEKIFSANANTLTNNEYILGVLKSIKQNIENDLLKSIGNLIFAEAFENLTEQAEYLFTQNYFLASGVILRSVLEENLRKKCQENEITITKDKPTLNDYNTELYKNAIYDKVLFKKIDALIAIGNDAAHNKPITKESIQDLLSGTKDILFRIND